MKHYELWRQRNEAVESWVFCETKNRPPPGAPAWDPDKVPAELVWTVEAASSNDAHRLYHEYMGWDPYQPMLREDGTPYPEDEATD